VGASHVAPNQGVLIIAGDGMNLASHRICLIYFRGSLKQPSCYLESVRRDPSPVMNPTVVLAEVLTKLRASASYRLPIDACT